MSDWTKKTETLGQTSNTAAPCQAIEILAASSGLQMVWGARAIQLLT